jgi:putative proteasome-type protease
MTYCLGLQCHDGLVLLSDSRTSAGVDNVTIHSKMRIYEVRGQRMFCLLTSGNLSITQSVISLLERDIQEAKEDPNVDTLLNQTNFLETVHYVGQRLRDVRRMHAEALDRAGISFNSNFILGGQIENQPPEIYQIYPEGNAIHASTESPFLQIGELKYGKPILDRWPKRLSSDCSPSMPPRGAISPWAPHSRCSLIALIVLRCAIASNSRQMILTCAWSAIAGRRV